MQEALGRRGPRGQGRATLGGALGRRWSEIAMQDDGARA